MFSTDPLFDNFAILYRRPGPVRCGRRHGARLKVAGLPAAALGDLPGGPYVRHGSRGMV